MVRCKEKPKGSDEYIDLKCSACGKTERVFVSKNSRFFYKCANFSGTSIKYTLTGHYDICKQCIQKMSCENGQVDIEKFKDVLKMINRPFIIGKYYDALKSKRELVGTYLKNTSLNGYNNMTWEDSVFNEGNLKEKKKSKKEEDEDEEEFVITPEMYRKWGKNYTEEDYKLLEENYEEWTINYKSDKLAEQKTFQFICLKELEIRKTREKGGNVDNLEKTLNTLMSAGGVTPRDMKASEDPANKNTLGMLIKDIETKRPCEHFEDKAIYKDYDKIGEYYERFILRPLKNLLIGSRDFDKEFSIEAITQQMENEDKELLDNHGEEDNEE